MRRIVLLVQLLAAVATARYSTQGYGDIFFTYANPDEKLGVQVVYRPEWIMHLESQNETQYWGCITFQISFKGTLILQTRQNLCWSTEGQYFHASRNGPGLTAGEWIGYEGEIYKKTGTHPWRCSVHPFRNVFDYFSGAYKVPEHVGLRELESGEWNYTTDPETTKCSTVMNDTLPEYFVDFGSLTEPPESPVIVLELVPVAITGVIVLCLLLVVIGQRIHFRYRRNLSVNRRLPMRETDNALPLATVVPINSNYGLPVYEDLPDADLPPGYEEASMLPAVTSEAESKV